ncbi:MAG: hypothetical protein KIT84_40130 [Labilithrix sp.]|nr:hypothetical protein [Labilithrix sp.]MCW5817275.1 hypothetical protein [Labilithrix sp.]
MSSLPLPTSVSGVRSQIAFVRTLLDEVERATKSSTTEPLSEQVVEELARLGCRCLELAAMLTTTTEMPRCA